MITLDVLIANYSLCPVIYTEVHTDVIIEYIDLECLN